MFLISYPKKVSAGGTMPPAVTPYYMVNAVCIPGWKAYCPEPNWLP